MIFVGSGAIDARDEILELAELIDAPVVAFRSGRGIVSNAHELGLTMAAAYRLWPNDRSDDRDRQPHGIAGVIVPLAVPAGRPEIDPDRYRSVGNAPVDARRRRGRRCPRRHARAARRGQQGRLQEDQRPPRRDPRGFGGGVAGDPEGPAADGLSQHPARGAAANAIVTDELSQVGFASWYGFPVYEPRTFITSGYQGTLGSGFPTALGAKVANPDRPVVAITGDGGFMFGVQELATAVQFNIGVVTLVFNNNAYGNVRRDQRERFEGRVVASDLVNPDFVKLAESFGVGRGAGDLAAGFSAPRWKKRWRMAGPI